MKNLSLFKIKDLFIKIFFSESCIFCEESGKSICDNCLIEIKSNKLKNKNIENIDWIRASLNYKNPKLKVALFFLKYHHNKLIANYLAVAIYEDLLDFIYNIKNIKHIKNDSDFSKIIIIPVPISKKRLIERDYNQSELLLKESIKEINIKNNLDLENNIYTDLLIKEKHTIKFSHTHSPKDREELIKNVFTVNKEKYSREFLKDKIFLIFDDITTTGSTFYEIRATLINSGADIKNIFGYALAH